MDNVITILRERLDALHVGDVKSAYVPFALGDIMVGKIPMSTMGDKILVVSDVGLLLAIMKRVKRLEFDMSNVTFLCHTEKLRKYAQGLGIKTWFSPYNELDAFFREGRVYTNDGEIYNLKDDMKCFDVILGNPPYNGMKRTDIPKHFDCFLKTGFRTHYTFIACERFLLKDNGIMLFVTPHKWLSDNEGISLREELFNDGKLTFLNMNSCPDWDAQTGNVALFIFQKCREQHAPDVQLMFHGNRALNVRSEIEMCILQKILQFDLPKIEFFRGCFDVEKFDDTLPEQNYVYAHGCHKWGRISFSKKFLDRIESANKKGQKFLLYPNYQRAPFKVTGKNPKQIKTPVQIVDPMPICATQIVVPTTQPDKMKKFLESVVAKFVWRVFFSDRNFAPTLTNVMPDLTSLLDDKFDDNDVYKLCNLSNEEISHIELLASTYGQGM